MATFPSLIPSDREYEPGSYPVADHTALSGKESRVRLSSVPIGDAVRVTFLNLTYDQMMSIVNHYKGESGSWRSFNLPSQFWNGVDNVNNYLAPGSAWKYVQGTEPEIFDYPCGGHDVTVALESVTGEGVGLAGAEFEIALSIATEKAAASNGKEFVIGLTIETGVGIAPPVSFTTTLSISTTPATGGNAGIAPPVALYINTSILAERPVGAREAAFKVFLRIFGADSQPSLWVSRLSTEHERLTNFPNFITGPFGSIRPGSNGESFQTFFILRPSENPRIVLVKRDNKGEILWQRWTAPLNVVRSGVIGRNSSSLNDGENAGSCPQVVALPDGGCVVLFKDSIDAPVGTNGPFFFWRFNSAGSVTVSRQYTSIYTGPIGAVLNGTEVVAMCRASRPVLVRIRLSDGAFLSARSFSFANEAAFRIYPTGSDCMVRLSNGNIVFRTTHVSLNSAAPKGYITEVSSDLATVVRSAGMDFGFASRFTALSDGSYLIVDDAADKFGAPPGTGYGAVRLDSSLAFVDRYSTNFNFPSNVFSAWFSGLQNHVTVAGGQNTGGFSVQYASSTNSLLISRFANGGQSITGLSRINLGSNIGRTFQDVELGPGHSHGIDAVSGRGFAHVVFRDADSAGSGTGCRVTAIGYALNQPESTDATFANSTESLDTGTCTNTMGVRGWLNPPTVTIPGAPPSVSAMAATGTSVTFTEAAATLSWSDPGGSLVWEQTRRIFV